MSALPWRRLLAWLSQGRQPPDIAAISPEQAKELLLLCSRDCGEAQFAKPVVRKERTHVSATRFVQG